jgi:hypothetical protein
VIQAMMLATSATRADLITAWATAGAAAGTIFTLIVAVLTLRSQVRASLRAQAARVTLDLEPDEKARSFVICNLSDLPINDVHVSARIFRRKISFFGKWIPLRPEKPNLAAGAEMKVPLPLLDNLTQLAAYVTFRDSSGSRWYRQWPSGLLKLQQRGPQRQAADIIAEGILICMVAVFMVAPPPDRATIIFSIPVFACGMGIIIIGINTSIRDFRKPLQLPTSGSSEECATPSEHP